MASLNYFLKNIYRLLRTVPSRSSTEFENKGITVGQNVTLNGGILYGNNVIGDFSSLNGNIEIGRWTTLGHHNILNSGPSEIKVGNYCQFGPYVSMYAGYHPLTRLTTYQNGKFLEGAIKGFGPSSPINIGSDVWIGHGSIILRGINIGDGTIIGSGSVVTKDIPEYSIAAGNPAKVIRKRFSANIIESIKDLEWWKYDEKSLASIKSVFLIDLLQDELKTIEELKQAKLNLRKYNKVEP